MPCERADRERAGAEREETVVVSISVDVSVGASHSETADVCVLPQGRRVWKCGGIEDEVLDSSFLVEARIRAAVALVRRDQERDSQELERRDGVRLSHPTDGPISDVNASIPIAGIEAVVEL